MPALSTTLPLALHPSPRKAAPVHGWYLTGKDPAAWLRALAEAGISPETVRVMALPDGRGALFTVPSGSIPGGTFRAVPFTCVHGILWIPCDAALVPALAAEEITALCPWAAVVWHPALAPAVFEAEDIRRAASLVAVPPRQSGPPWSGAVPVDAMLSELNAVRLAVVFDPRTVFAGEEQEIGSEPPKGLPAPGEKPSRRGGWLNWVSAAVSAARRNRPPKETPPVSGPSPAGTRPTIPAGLIWLAAAEGVFLYWALQLPPSSVRRILVTVLTVLLILTLFLIAATALGKMSLSRRGSRSAQASSRHGAAGAGGGTGAGSAGPGLLQQWMGRVSEEIERRRYRAVEELLDDLDRNPDKALRRAIPLGGGALHRGVAAPDASLADRNPDFSAGRLNQSGPVDQWDLPAQYLQRLRSRYLELARAEAQRGKHRAAAYIFAHLLGDLTSAAATLRAGGFHREAATLYRTRLNNTGAAAECLAEAGCHLEAAELYEESGRWMEAGDAYARGGLQDKAVHCYRLLSDEYLARRDVLQAAAVLEQKLETPEESLKVLQGAWPYHPSATTALLAAYDLMARRQWISTALEYTQELTAAPPPFTMQEPLAKVLTGLARAWPHPVVRETAREGALTLIAARLARPQDTAAQRRAGAMLAELEPGDPLLRGDVARFTARAAAEAAAAGRIQAPPARQLPSPSVHALMRLEPSGVTVLAAEEEEYRFYTAIAGQGGEIYALAAVRSGDSHVLCLLRARWEAKTAQIAASWAGWHPEAGIPGLVEGLLGMLMLTGPCLPRGFPERFPALVPVAPPDEGRPPVSAGLPAWMKNRPGHVTTHGAVWFLAGESPEGSVVLDFATAGGELVQRAVPALDEEQREIPGPVIAIAAHGRYVFVAVPSGLLVWDGEKSVFEPLPSPPLCLAVPPSWLTEAVAVGMEHGAQLYHPRDGRMLTIDRDLSRPLPGFTSGGHVLAVSEAGGVAARISGGRFSRYQRFPWTGGRPLAIVLHPDNDRFAILTAEGRLEAFRLLEQ